MRLVSVVRKLNLTKNYIVIVCKRERLPLPPIHLPLLALRGLFQKSERLFEQKRIFGR